MPYILTSTANPSSPQSWVKMETESILSGHSEFNQRLVNGHRTTPRPLPPLKGEIFFCCLFSLCPPSFFFSIKLLTKLRFFFYFLVFSQPYIDKTMKIFGFKMCLVLFCLLESTEHTRSPLKNVSFYFRELYIRISRRTLNNWIICQFRIT